MSNKFDINAAGSPATELSAALAELEVEEKLGAKLEEVEVEVVESTSK